jgi:energy-converting hydrogenase A subunit M
LDLTKKKETKGKEELHACMHTYIHSAVALAFMNDIMEVIRSYTRSLLRFEKIIVVGPSLIEYACAIFMMDSV